MSGFDLHNENENENNRNSQYLLLVSCNSSSPPLKLEFAHFKHCSISTIQAIVSYLLISQLIDTLIQKKNEPPFSTVEHFSLTPPHCSNRVWWRVSWGQLWLVLSSVSSVVSPSSSSAPPDPSSSLKSSSLNSASELLKILWNPAVDVQ